MNSKIFIRNDKKRCEISKENSFVNHGMEVVTVIYFSKKDLFVSCSDDEKVMFWNGETQKCFKTVHDETTIEINHILKWNDSEFLYCGNEVVSWSIETMKPSRFDIVRRDETLERDNDGENCGFVQMMRIDSDQFLATNQLNENYIFSFSKKCSVKILNTEIIGHYRMKMIRSQISSKLFYVNQHSVFNGDVSSTDWEKRSERATSIRLIDYINDKELKDFVVQNDIKTICCFVRNMRKNQEYVIAGGKIIAIFPSLSGDKENFDVSELNASSFCIYRIDNDNINDTCFSLFVHEKYLFCGGIQGAISLYEMEEDLSTFSILGKKKIHGSQKSYSDPIVDICLLEKNESRKEIRVITCSGDCSFSTVKVENISFGVFSLEKMDLVERLEYLLLLENSVFEEDILFKIRIGNKSEFKIFKIALIN